jgi:hypothetical protein
VQLFSYILLQFFTIENNLFSVADDVVVVVVVDDVLVVVDIVAVNMTPTHFLSRHKFNLSFFLVHFFNYNFEEFFSPTSRNN